jgi:hypothetical protein
MPLSRFADSRGIPLATSGGSASMR